MKTRGELPAVSRAEKIKDAMREMARTAQYVAQQDPAMLKSGRKWQDGFAAGTRSALIIFARFADREIDAVALDYMQNAAEIIACKPRQANARLIRNATMRAAKCQGRACECSYYQGASCRKCAPQNAPKGAR